jgi:hypothetical protein
MWEGSFLSDHDLDDLLVEALRQARLRKPNRRTKDETHIDYAKRLAEKGLYRRLSREANALMDALRFEYWFAHEGAEGLSLDQWRIFIDSRIAKSTKRLEKNSEAPTGASVVSGVPSSSNGG